MRGWPPSLARRRMRVTVCPLTGAGDRVVGVRDVTDQVTFHPTSLPVPSVEVGFGQQQRDPFRVAQQRLDREPVAPLPGRPGEPPRQPLHAARVDPALEEPPGHRPAVDEQLLMPRVRTGRPREQPVDLRGNRRVGPRGGHVAGDDLADERQVEHLRQRLGLVEPRPARAAGRPPGRAGRAPPRRRVRVRRRRRRPRSRRSAPPGPPTAG